MLVGHGKLVPFQATPRPIRCKKITQEKVLESCPTCGARLVRTKLRVGGHRAGLNCPDGCSGLWIVGTKLIEIEPRKKDVDEDDLDWLPERGRVSDPAEVTS
jgi:hypothetical protein